MEVKTSVGHLFRHEYSKIVAFLTNKYSSYKIDLIEDAVQEALLKAMKVWGYQNIPDNPSAWLYRVANNHLIDQLRRESRSVELNIPEDQWLDSSRADEKIPGDLGDEQLKMIFACCHPALNASDQIMLSLKLLCGLSVKEIANALLKKEDAVKKALARAKQKFKQEVGELLVPEGIELRKRLSVVLRVIYLLFNEGYKTTGGEQLTRKDICEDAIRLGAILQRNRYCDTPELNALLALMCFNAARLDARLGSGKELITLENQDRSLWDAEYILWGIHFLSRASNGVNISEYHLEAAIASFYSTAKSFRETDWESILTLYDLLIKVNRSPIVALNRLVVLEKVKGAEAALKEIQKLEKEKSLRNSYLLYSIKADFQLSLNNRKDAKQLLKQAIQLTGNIIEKKFLQKKLAGI